MAEEKKTASRGGKKKTSLIDAIYLKYTKNNSVKFHLFHLDSKKPLFYAGLRQVIFEVNFT